MPSTESSTIIEAPTQRIWDYVSDFGNWEHFTTRYGLLSVKRQSFRLSEDCVAGENATVIVTSNGSSLPWTITAWNPLQEISLFTECCGWLKRYASAITITVPSGATGQLLKIVNIGAGIATINITVDGSAIAQPLAQNDKMNLFWYASSWRTNA